MEADGRFNFHKADIDSPAWEPTCGLAFWHAEHCIKQRILSLYQTRSAVAPRIAP